LIPTKCTDKVIYKYKLSPLKQQDIEMPKGAIILTLQMQDDTPCIWALVNPLEEKEVVTFELIATGEKIENADLMEYIGTFQVTVGVVLVFHVFKHM
jgi:hypothetical protein